MKTENANVFVVSVKSMGIVKSLIRESNIDADCQFESWAIVFTVYWFDYDWLFVFHYA